mgnify:FL=1
MRCDVGKECENDGDEVVDGGEYDEKNEDNYNEV